MKAKKTCLFLAAAASVSVNCACSANPVAYVAAAKSERAVADGRFHRSGDAIKDYDRMLQLNPRSVVGYLSRANVKNELHDYRGAIADDNIAISLDPKNALAYNNRGIDRYDSGDYHGAIQDFSHALKLGSKEGSWSYWWRGNARDKLGDYQGAIEDLTRAIKLDPDYALPYGDRARVRADLGDKAGALSDLEKALATPQGFAYPHLQRQMADLLSSMGKSKEAVGYYDHVDEMHDDISAVYARGFQNALGGNFVAAASDYCRAISKSFGLMIQKDHPE